MKFFDEIPKSSHSLSRIDWAEAKEHMRQNPGKWGLVAENMSTSNVTQVRSGNNKHFRGDDLVDFAFISRRPEGTDYKPGYSDIYGCYKPDPNEVPPLRKRVSEPAIVESE